MTEQEILAIEVMCELGMDPFNIATDPGWERGITMDEVLSIVDPKRLRHRMNTVICYAGEARSISEWANIMGISRHTIRERLRRGWSVEDALTIKTRKQCNNTTKYV